MYRRAVRGVRGLAHRFGHRRVRVDRPDELLDGRLHPQGQRGLRNQLRRARPDLDIVPLRGNVDTRLAKVDRGEVDAILLARAGLVRLGLAERASEIIEPSVMLPAVGQGALALAARAGDGAVVYHSGAKEAVGLALVVKAAYPDPGDSTGKLVAVDLAAGKELSTPVGLEALKRSPAFRDSPLLRQGRLSVVPLTAEQWKAVLSLSEAPTRP